MEEEAAPKSSGNGYSDGAHTHTHTSALFLSIINKASPPPLFPSLHALHLHIYIYIFIYAHICELFAVCLWNR